MNKRLLFFVLGLALLSAAVLWCVTVWLPEMGVTRVGPVLPVGPVPGQDPTAAVPGGILVAPADRIGRPGFWLRPFGLHREGLPGVLWYIGSLASWLILAVMALFLVPRRIEVLARVVSNDWGQRLLALVIGLLGYLGIGLLVFLIFINVVGWPILLLLTMGVYLATGLGLVAVSLSLGAAVCRFVRLDDRGPLFRLGVGVILLFLGSIIPYLGWIVVGGSAALGFGVALWTRLGSITGWSLDEVSL
jgi:hypothetical protein